MSEAAAPMPALGVGAIIGGSFAIFFRRIPAFILVAFAPLLAMQAVSGVVGRTLISTVQGFAANPAAHGGLSPTILAFVAVTSGLSMLTMAASAGLMVQIAYDASLGRPVRLPTYVRTGSRRLPMLSACSLLLVLAMGLLFAGPVVSVYLLLPHGALSGLAKAVLTFVLSLPTVWLAVVVSAFVPAVVIEGAGLDAFRRSAALTSGYRLPVFGCLVVLGVCTIAFTMVLQGCSAALVFWLAPKLFGALAYFIVRGLLTSVFLQSVPLAICLGLFFAGVALIYARLRELKDGGSIEVLSEVFT